MTDDLRILIEQIIRAELKNVKVEAVEIEPDLDFDGDEVLRVKVVFSADRDFDVAHAKGLVRHIRSELMEKSRDYVFPILSFVSDAENKRVQAAAG